MSRTRNASRNIIWGILNKIVTLLLPFAMRTIMIYTLGDLYLGLNGLFTSILQVLNISELGISSAIIFSMYRPIAEGRDAEVRALMNFYRKCYRVIGLVVAVVGLALLPVLRILISGDVPSDINIYILYLMNLASTVLSYELFAYRSSLLVANQRNDVVSKVSTVCAIGQFSAQMIVLMVFRNYYLYIAAVLVNSIANNVIAAVICKRMYPQYYCKGTISPKMLHEIKMKVGGMVFQKIGGVVLSSVDTIVISAFLGLVLLAVYQNYYYVITSLFGILSVIMSSLVSTVGNSVALESVEKNYKDFRKFNYIYVWIVTWCSVCLLCLYQPFMQLWVGTSRMLPDYMVFLFAIYFFVHKWCDMLYVYQEATGIWWETKFVPLTAAAVNLVVNLILVQVIGLAGILISTIVSVVFIYDVGYARVVFKSYFKEKGNLKEFTLNQIRYLLIAVIAAVVTIFACNRVVVESAVLKLILNGCICVVLPNLVLGLLGFRLEEFKDAAELGKRILNRKRRQKNKGEQDG